MSKEMDDLINAATDKLEALEAALYHLKQVRGRYTSDDGAVSAEVDSDGALVGLTLAESVTSLPPAEVGQLIIWACQQAAQDAGIQRSEVVSTLNSAFAPEESGAVPGDGKSVSPAGWVGTGRAE